MSRVGAATSAGDDAPDHRRPRDSSELAAIWNARYGATDRLWSGTANPVLVTEASGLAPGVALDAGCGEGDDSLWLASRGWLVTGIDFSEVAVARAAREASRLRLTGRALFEQRDLSQRPPPPASFDLVSAQHLHVLPEDRDAIYRGLAAAVRPGGVLLMVLHDARDIAAGVAHPPPFSMLDADALRTYADGFALVHLELRPRATIDRAGEPATAHDLVLRAIR